ncbi:MAG: PAS domain S-box protein [Bacteroidota bacterium]
MKKQKNTSSDSSNHLQSTDELSANKLMDTDENQYAKFFDLAPTAYFILSSDAVISNLNHSAAKMLDAEQSNIINRKLDAFIAEKAKSTFFRFLNDIFKSNENVSCELELNPDVNGQRYLYFTGIATENNEQCFLNAMDITERKRSEEALIERNELLTKYIKHSPIYSFIKEVSPTESRVIIASDNYIDMVGIAGYQMIGKTMTELFPQELAAKMTNDDWEVVSKAKVLELDEELNDRKYKSIKFPIIKDDKNLLAGYTIDVSERVLIEEKMRESELRYRTLFRVMPLGILVMDENGVILDANEEITKTTFYSHEELIGSNVRMLTTQDTIKLVDGNIKRILAGEILSVEILSCRKDGSLRTFILHETAITLPDGQKGILSISNDITEQKKIELALEESNEKYRGLIELAVDGIILSSAEGIIIDANTSICEMKGVTKIDIIGTHISNSIFSEAAMKHAQLQLARLKKGEIVISELDILRSDESEISVEVLTQMLPNATFQSIFRDITNRKRGQEELHYLAATLEEQVIERTSELTKAYAALLQTRLNYESFFNTIDEFLFVINEQGNIIHMNTTVINRLGYIRKELLEQHIMMIHPVEFKDKALLVINEIINGSTEFYSIPIVTISGIQIPVETRVSHGQWDGQPVIFVVSKDISEIKFSEEKFSKVFHINPSACSLADVGDRKYVEVNDAFCTLLGFNKDEVIGKTAIELGIMTREQLNSITLKADINGKIINAEAEIKTKNGDVKYVMFSAEIISVQGKKYRYTVVFDITERKLTENALRESEEKYRSIFENVQDVFYTVDLTGTLIEISPSIKYFSEFTREDLIGQSVFNLYNNIEDRQVFLSELSKNGELRDYELVLKAKTGAKLITSINARIVFDSDGNPSYINGAIRDITERKLAAEALKESQNKYQFIVENTDDILWTMNPDFTIDYVSPTVLKLLGYSVEEHLKQSFEDFMLPESVNMIRSEFQIGMMHLHKKEFDKLRSTANLEVVLVRKDKKQLFGNINLYIIRDENYQILKIRGITSDITERKLAEKALRESEAALTISQQIAHIGSWELDEKTHELKWSDESYRIFGFIPNEIEVSVELFMNCIHPEDRSFVEKSVNEAWDSQSHFSVDHRIILPNREVRIVHEQAEIIYDSNNLPWKWMGTVQDITERKQAEDKLLNITIEVEERERQRFASELHDGLGPLLSTVKLYFQWLAETKDEEKANMIIEKGNKNIDHAIQATREIAQGLSLDMLSKSGYVETVVNFIHNIIATKKLDINFIYNSRNRFNFQLETTFYRITTELINNALKHANSSKVEIEFNHNKVGKLKSLRYFDNGIGFEIGSIDKASNGLGLTSIKQRVKALKGLIKIDTAPGKGLKVYIEIPC